MEGELHPMSDLNKARRKFIKTAAYAAPVVMSMKATASFANTGSDYNRMNCNNGYGNGGDCTPPGLVGNTNAAHVDQDD